MRGIEIPAYIGVGDAVQFSSLPENYYRATGEKLVDVSKCWIYDHNPYVVRDVEATETFNLWNFPTRYDWPRPRESVYLSNAEIWASLFKVPVVLNRPRLYKFENFPIEERQMILFQPFGKSQGPLPDFVIEHVLKKYSKMPLVQIGKSSDPDIGITRIKTETLWDLAQVISQARMLIGPDSGPSWIAACYPDVVIRKVRIRGFHGQKEYKDWIPMEIDAHHSHWDDRAFHMFHITEDDCGFMQSYKRL